MRGQGDGIGLQGEIAGVDDDQVELRPYIVLGSRIGFPAGTEELVDGMKSGRGRAVLPFGHRRLAAGEFRLKPDQHAHHAAIDGGAIESARNGVAAGALADRQHQRDLAAAHRSTVDAFEQRPQMRAEIELGRRADRSLPDGVDLRPGRQFGDAGPDRKAGHRLGLAHRNGRRLKLPAGRILGRGGGRRLDGRRLIDGPVRHHRNGGGRGQQRADHQCREQQGERRARRAQRRNGDRGHLGLGRLQLALLAGRLEPRQELLVDVPVGIGIALQLLQLHERLAVDQHLGLEGPELLFQRVLLLELGLVFRFRRFDVLLPLDLDLPVDVGELAVGDREIRMTVAIDGLLLRDLLVEGRALRAQHAEQVLLHRSLDIGLEVSLHLLVARLGLLGARTRCGDLLGEVGHPQLLRGGFLASVDDLVLEAEGRDGVFGSTQALAQRLQPVLEPAGCLVGRLGANAALAGDERLGDGIGVIGGAIRAVRGERNRNDIGEPATVDLEAVAEPFEQARHVGVAARDVLVVGDLELLDQGAQKAVGFGDLDLALQRRGVLADAGQHLLVRGHAQLAGIEHDKRRGGVADRKNDQSHDAECEQRRGQHQDAPAILAQKGERAGDGQRSPDQDRRGAVRLHPRSPRHVPRSRLLRRGDASRRCAATGRHGVGLEIN